MIKVNLKTLFAISLLTVAMADHAYAAKKMTKTDFGYRVQNEDGSFNSSINYSGICSDFKEGRACVNNNGRFYFIDESEKVVSDVYSKIEKINYVSFNGEGDFFVADKGDKKNILTRLKVLVETTDKTLETVVFNDLHKTFFYTGDFLISASTSNVYENVKNISSLDKGIIAKDRITNKKNVYNIVSEEQILKSAVDDVWVTNNGYLIVMENYKYGLFTAIGKEIISPVYETLAFENSQIVVIGLNGFKLAMNLETQKNIIDLSEKYLAIRLDDSKRAFIVKGEDGYGFVALDGALISFPQFDEVKSFDQNGVAEVKFQGEWKRINLQGEILKDSPNYF